MKQAEIANLLPEIFRRTLEPDSPLTGLLAVMEGLQAPGEAVLADLEAYFDPYRTPDVFVPYLASWLDLDRFMDITPQRLDESTAGHLFPGGIGRLRELVTMAAQLEAWRGTARGLILFLETATGIAGFTVNEQVRDDRGRIRPFHIHVQAPAAARPYRLLIEHIVEQEKPAYVSHTLRFKEDG